MGRPGVRATGYSFTGTRSGEGCDVSLTIGPILSQELNEIFRRAYLEEVGSWTGPAFELRAPPLTRNPLTTPRASTSRQREEPWPSSRDGRAYGRAMTYEEWIANIPGNSAVPHVTVIDSPMVPPADMAWAEVVILATALRRAANRLEEAMDEVRKRRVLPRELPPATLGTGPDA